MGMQQDDNVMAHRNVTEEKQENGVSSQEPPQECGRNL
jgi:hypothetical protein